jgi:hypothetical protein
MVQNQPYSFITQAIQQAISDPIEANLYELLNQFEQIVNQLPQAKQLEVAGNILMQLVELYATRANSLLEAWEDRFNPNQSGPLLTAEMLQEVLRHTMTLNLEELIEYPAYSQRSATASPEIGQSVAVAVEKENVLEFLDTIALEEAKRQALAISHAEDITAWARAIADWMQQHQQASVSLLELQQALQMPFVSVWLGVLLGGYSVEQRGEFYQTEAVWVNAQFDSVSYR